MTSTERSRRTRERQALRKKVPDKPANPTVAALPAAMRPNEATVMRIVDAGTAARGTEAQREAEQSAFAAGMAAQAFVALRQGATCPACEQRVEAVDARTLVQWVESRPGMWRYFDWLRREGLFGEWESLRRVAST